MLVLWRLPGSPIKIGDITVTPYFDENNYELEIESSAPFSVANIIDNACLYKHVLRIYRGRAFVIDGCLFRVIQCNLAGTVIDITIPKGKDYVATVKFFRRRNTKPKTDNSV